MKKGVTPSAFYKLRMRYLIIQNKRELATCFSRFFLWDEETDLTTKQLDIESCYNVNCFKNPLN